MNIAQSKIELAQKVLQTQDRQILKAVELIFSQEDKDFELSEATKMELDRLRKQNKAGKLASVTLAQIRKNALSKIKK
jgi:hypothetical protein